MTRWLSRLLRRPPAPRYAAKLTDSTFSALPADPQDTAFIALGAAAIWTTTYSPPGRQFAGNYVEFIGAAIDFAPLVSAASALHSDALFVWAYHVATPFGRWVGGALLDAGRPGGVTRAEAALALEGIIQRAYGWSEN